MRKQDAGLYYGRRVPEHALDHAKQVFRHIALIARSLKSLVCLDFHNSHFAGAPFLNLRELTIRNSGLVQIESLHTPLPRLERLHLYARYPSFLLKNLSSTCPQLTHLKFTGFEFEYLIDKLKQAWGISPYTLLENEIEPLSLPPHLQSIILQPAFSTRLGVWGTTKNPFGRIVQDLVEFARSEEARTHGLVVQKPTISHNYYQQAMDDWLDRMGGGLGCWEVKNQLG